MNAGQMRTLAVRLDAIEAVGNGDFGAADCAAEVLRACAALVDACQDRQHTGVVASQRIPECTICRALTTIEAIRP